MTKIVHALIAKTAKAMAAEIYEVCASNDAFYKAHPNINRFIAKHWKDYIGYTRNAFAQMLADPKYDQKTKDEIYEAMICDGVYKAPPPIDLRQLRLNAGFDPDGHKETRRTQVGYLGSTRIN